MKRLLFSVIITLLCLSASAEDNTVKIGYCNGEMATSTQIELTGKGWVSSAVHIPAAALATYQGNAITAVNAALVARINIDTLTVWIRSSLTGDNLAEGTITRTSNPAINKGWNTVNLNSAYNITASTGDVYVGYSFHQKANVQAVSVVGDAMDNTSYVKLGTEAWKNISDKGVLSIEAVVVGSNVPKYDLGITSARISPYPSAGINAMKVTTAIHNFGANDVSGFTVACSTAGVNAINTHIDATLKSTESSVYTFVITPSVATTSNNVWTVAISNIDNGTDEHADNNSMTATYAYLRNALVEEFTTEKCSNCPRMASTMHEALNSKAEYADRVFVVCHHAGYYTDEFTQPCDNDYTWFYNEGGSTYAPSLMVNREPDFESIYATGLKTATFIPQSVEELTGVWDKELARPAYSVVGVNLSFNADSSQVTANVNCLHNESYSTANPHLCVFMVEDDVVAKSQAGYEGTYYQQHVCRAYNSTWGEPVNWTDNTFAYAYTFNVDKSWNKAKMQVIAFLGNYDSNDMTNCVIDNSAMAKLVSSTSDGISATTVKSGDVKEVARYSVSGQRLTSPTNGINIIKYSDGTVRKVIERSISK
jgi:hypothetical protein